MLKKVAAAFTELEVEGIDCPTRKIVCKCWTLQINVFPTTRNLAGD